MVITLEKSDVVRGFKHPSNYTIEGVVGSGSFGLTVTATKGECEAVAIKNIFPNIWKSSGDFRYIKALIREAVILTYARNPHIVYLKTIYFDMGRGDPLDAENVNSLYIVMENCGQNISTYLKKYNTTINRMDFAAKIVYSVACGLNFLESFEIYHRDLKPDNICIDKTGRVRIIDLGLARKSPEESSNVTGGISTVCYRSPNFLLGMKYKEANDRWSLGCIFGYVLSNKHIFNHGVHTLNSVEYDTLLKIVELIGNPGQDFIDLLEEEKSKKRTKVDIMLANNFIIDIVSERERMSTVYELFEHYQNHDQYNNGVALLNGLLDWLPERRISIKDILSHPFVEIHRNTGNEKLPPKELCGRVKEELDKHEKELEEMSKDKDKPKGKADARKYLFEYVKKRFGHDKDLDDYFPYSIPSDQ